MKTSRVSDMKAVLGVCCGAQMFTGWWYGAWVSVYASRHCTNPNPFEEWKAQRMERQSENFTGVRGKLPWTLRCMKVQFVSHLFCLPSIRRKGARRPPRRKCPCEGLWEHRGSCRFNLPAQSFPFPLCTIRALNVIPPLLSSSSPPKIKGQCLLLFFWSLKLRLTNFGCVSQCEPLWNVAFPHRVGRTNRYSKDVREWKRERKMP